MEHRPISSESARAALLARTQRVQAHRRMRRRTASAGALVLVFVAGLATGRLTPAPGAPDAPPDIGASEAVAAAAIEPPETLEARATEASAEERPALLRRAGDLFVQRGDVAEALRCYRDHLASLPPQQVGRPAPEDSWLLAALKHAQD